MAAYSAAAEWVDARVVRRAICRAEDVAMQEPGWLSGELCDGPLAMLRRLALDERQPDEPDGEFAWIDKRLVTMACGIAEQYALEQAWWSADDACDMVLAKVRRLVFPGDDADPEMGVDTFGELW